jgi:hypothetical protein
LENSAGTDSLGTGGCGSDDFCRSGFSSGLHLPRTRYPDPSSGSGSQHCSVRCPSDGLKLPHHQCTDPGADSLSIPHLRMICADLTEDSCPGRISDDVLAPSRTRIQALPPSRGHNDQAFPTPNATRRVPSQWARTTRPPAPVRGPTAPSTPRSPHWREEDYPKAGFPRAMEVFFFLPIPLCLDRTLAHRFREFLTC